MSDKSQGAGAAGTNHRASFRTGRYPWTPLCAGGSLRRRPLSGEAGRDQPRPNIIQRHASTFLNINRFAAIQRSGLRTIAATTAQKRIAMMMAKVIPGWRV